MKNVLKKCEFAVIALVILTALTACSASGSKWEDVKSAVAESVDVKTKVETANNETKTATKTEAEESTESTLEIVETATENFEFRESNGEITIKNIKVKQAIKYVLIPVKLFLECVFDNGVFVIINQKTTC